MPLPGTLAEFNKSITNRFTRPFASRLGGFAVIHHVGRRSGNKFETPVNAWIHDDSIVVALTYGSDTDWLKNCTRAGQSLFVMSGEEIAVGTPVQLDTAEGHTLVPKFVGQALRLINVEEFVDFPIVSRSSEA